MVHHKLGIFNEWIDVDLEKSDSLEIIKDKIISAFKKKTGKQLIQDKVGNILYQTESDSISSEIIWGEVP